MKMFITFLTVVFGNLISLCIEGLSFAEVNLGDRRIEVYLTNFARKFKDGQNVGNFIAPPFNVKKSSDKYLVYQKSEFRVYDNKISGRAKAKEIKLKADEATYSCEEFSLATFISDRDVRNMNNVGVIRLKENEIGNVKDAQMRSREKRVLDIAGNQAVITQGADIGNDWSTQGTGTPVFDIVAGLKTIEDATGAISNAIIMPYDVAMTMILTDEWKEYFKYTVTGPQGLRQAIDGLRQLGLQPMISGARGLSTYEGTASDPAWEKLFNNKCLVFYRETNPTPRSLTLMFSPNTIMDKVDSYRVPGERGERYEIYEEIDELLVCAECGYLMRNCITQ